MNREQYLLTKVAEEAAEIAQIALKAQQFGLYSTYPGDPTTNVENLHKEFTDLIAVYKIFCEESQIDDTVHDWAVQAKVDKVNHFYRISQNLGTIS